VGSVPHAGRRAATRVTTRADGDLAVGLAPELLGVRRVAVLDRPWFWLRQVHGGEVVVALDPADIAGPAPGVAADAVVTTSDGWALAIHTADCAPVALIDERGMLGAVHAGWRGLAEGIVERTVEVMRSAGAGRIRARLGPCIHAECYEFGEADLAPLVERFGPDVVGETTQGRKALDVPAAVAAALGRVGVEELVVDPSCTSCDDRYFSHRARGEAGRQAMLVWWADDD
jgi:YfiH family protein